MPTRDWLSLAGAPGAADLLLLLARLTVLGAIAHLALLALRRAPAAARHLLATSALAIMLALPLAAALGPRWGLIRVPEGWAGGPATAAPRFETSAPVAERSIAIDGARQVGPQDPPPAAALPPAPPAASVDPSPGAGPARAAAPALPLADAPAAAVVLFLLVGAALAIARGRSAIAIGRAARVARPVTDANVRRVFERALRRLDVRGEVALRVTDRLAVPGVCGIARPTLLLPEAALGWSEARLELVFLHELAHIRRRDGVALLVAQTATVLLWFQPLAWTLARIARRECERACDDVVLLAGVRASDYAGELLDIARAAGGAAAVPALAFARRSSLEGRLRSILSPDARRGPLSRRAIAGLAIAALLVLVPLSAIGVVAAPRECDGGGSTSDKTGSCSAPPAALVRAIARVEAVMVSRTTTVTTARVHTLDAVVASSSARSWPDLGAAESKSGAEWYGTAKGHYDARRFSAAGESYERAARAGYRTDIAWYNAACSYALDGQKNRALGALSSALDEGFKDEDLLQTDTDLNSIRTDPRFRLLVRGATASDEADKRDALRSKYRDLTDSGDTTPDQLRSVGISLMRAGDTERAAEAFRREFALDSTATSIYNEACAHALGRRSAQALETLERSIVAGYGDADKLTSDADLSSLRGQPQFERLVKLADDLSLNFGFMDGKGTWRGRLSRCERVAREHPDFGRAWWNLGFVQLRADEPEQSQESFGHALDLGYRVSNTLYNLACAAAQSGHVDAAFQLLSRSAAAGMDVAGHARSDSDLEPLHSDPRWRALNQQWRGERAERTVRHTEKKVEKQERKEQDTKER